MTRNADSRLVNELERPQEFHRVQHAAGGTEGIVPVHALIVFVVGRHFAAARAVCVDVEHDKFTAGQLFGNALVIALVDAASVNHHHRRQLVLVAHTGGIVQIAFQLCPARVNGYLLHLDVPAGRGDQLRTAAENQDGRYQNQKQVPAAGFRFEGQPVLLFHFQPFPFACSPDARFMHPFAPIIHSAEYIINIFGIERLTNFMQIVIIGT